MIEGVCAKLDLAPSIEKKNNKANHKNLFPSKLCTVLSPLFWFYFVKAALGGERFLDCTCASAETNGADT